MMFGNNTKEVDNFYEEYSIKKMIDIKLHNMFVTLDIQDPKEKMKHLEKVCNMMLGVAQPEHLENLKLITTSFLEEKRKQLIGDSEKDDIQ
jgi:hypothetical protein